MPNTQTLVEKLTNIVDQYAAIISLQAHRHAYASALKSSIMYEMAGVDTRPGSMDAYLHEKIKHYTVAINVAESL